MSQFLQWLTMGGYFMYVWPAYGLVGIVLVMNLLSVKWKKKQARQRLQQWFSDKI